MIRRVCNNHAAARFCACARPPTDRLSRTLLFPGLFLVDALTSPVIFMFLGLPVRLYLVALALLAANTVGLIVAALLTYSSTVFDYSWAYS